MTHKSHNRKLSLFASLAALLILLTGQLAAAPLQSVVQSYVAPSNLQKGMIVRLSGPKSSQVTPATSATAAQMDGVVVDPSEAPVTLTPTVSGNQQQVYVATSGRYDVLVSNQNGAINPGDYIGVSSLAGVGMKTDGQQSEILGKAAAGFDGQHNTVSTAVVHSQNGRTLSVTLGRIPVDIAIGPNPVMAKPSNVPGFLLKASALITNQAVPPWRLYAAATTLVAATILAGSLLYSGVRNGMVAIGRNPLAKSSILRNLLQVILSSIIIFGLGLGTVYLLLKL